MPEETNELVYVNWSTESSKWATEVTNAGHISTRLELYRLVVAYALRELAKTSESIPIYDESIFNVNFAWGDLDPDGTFMGMLRLLCPEQKELHKYSQHLAEYGVQLLKDNFGDPQKFDVKKIFEPVDDN